MITTSLQDNMENYVAQGSAEKSPSVGSWGAPKEFVGTPTQRFDLEWLPDIFRDYGRAQCNYYGVSPELVGSVLLYMGGTACQPHNIWLREGWAVPTFINMITVGKPGEKKSAIRSECVRPIDDYVKEWNRAHRDEITKSHQKKEYLRKRRDRALADAVKDEGLYLEAEQSAVDFADYEEIVPKKIYVSDCTPERLVMLMAEQGGMLNVISAEGAFIDNILGRYSGQPNADAVLKGFDMDSIEVDRVGRTGETIESPRFSFLQCIQPVVYSKLSGNSELTGQGLLDRCLLCCPASSIGKMKFYADPIPEKFRVHYDNRMMGLLQSRDNPRWLRFTPEAERMFASFADAFNSRIVTDFEGLEGAGAKHVGIVGRICGILELMGNPDAKLVTVETVERALMLSEYYQEQLKLIHNGHVLNVEESLAEYLWSRILSCHEKGWTELQDGKIFVSYRTLNRACNKRELRKKDDYIEPLKLLQGMNLVDFDEKTFKRVEINPKGVD